MTHAQAALETLLWSNYLDGEYEPDPDLVNRVDRDWKEFRFKAETIGFNPDNALAVMLHPDNEGDIWNQVQHDFMLTRDYHGAGFWSGNWTEPWGRLLTQLAHTFPPLHLSLTLDNTLIAE